MLNIIYNEDTSQSLYTSTLYFIYLSLCDDKFFSCTGIRIPESGKFFLWNPESWALESGIQCKEWGITLTIGIPNPGPTDKDWNPQHGRESRIQDCLEFPYMVQVNTDVKQKEMQTRCQQRTKSLKK